MALHWSHKYRLLWKTSRYAHYILYCDPNKKSAFGDYECPLLLPHEEESLNAFLCCAHLCIYLLLLKVPKHWIFNVPIFYHLMLFSYHCSGARTPFYTPEYAYPPLIKAICWALSGCFLRWLTTHKKETDSKEPARAVLTAVESPDSMQVIKFVPLRDCDANALQPLAILCGNPCGVVSAPASDSSSDTLDGVPTNDLEQLLSQVPENMAVRGRYSDSPGYYDEMYDPETNVLDAWQNGARKRFV